MSVIIRLQNLPWSANALDIRNFFRGLSIPEGGVHIVGGELGDAFIAFSTDEDARQAMMLDGGKIKEIQVKLHLSSRSEMHKVIEAARQTVPLLSLAPQQAPPVPPPAPTITAPTPTPVLPAVITPFSAALSNNPLSNFGIPGLGNPQEIPQPAVIELPSTQVSPNDNSNQEEDREEERIDKRREKDRRRSRTRSRSRERDRKDRKRDRRDRSRSRERRRRDRSRSRESRRDRKRDRKERSRSRDRSPSRRSRDYRKSPSHSQEKEITIRDAPQNIPNNPFGNPGNLPPQLQQMLQANAAQKVPVSQNSPHFSDSSVTDAINKVQELAKKRNPNAFQGDQNGGKQQQALNNRSGMGRGQGGQRERRSRFTSDEIPRDCCVAIRNAPNHTSYGDVRRFFPYMIDKHGIKMINDNMGRRTGNIFVRFTDSRSKHLALTRKNNELKNAPVTVEDLDDDTYDAAVDSFLPYREDNDDEEVLIAEQEHIKSSFTVLKLSDMPYYVKEHDIIKTFNNYSLLSITLKECRHTRTKIAFVQFAKADEAKIVFDRRDRFVFGRKQLVITPITDEEFEKQKVAMIPKNESTPNMEIIQEVTAPRDPRQRRQQFDNNTTSQGGPTPLLSQGPQATPFFSPPFGQNAPFPPVQNPASINQFNPVGQYPAPQFGGFPGPTNIDPRTAATNWANRPPFPNQMDQMPAPIMSQMPRVPPKNMDDEPLDCVLMKGLPRDATDRTIVSFLSDTGAVPARIHLMLDANGMPSGDCFCEFRSTQEARLAASKHGQNLENCRVTVDIVPRSVVEEALEGPKSNDSPMPQDGMVGAVGTIGTGPPQFFDTMSRGNFNNRGSFRGRGGYDRGSFDRGGFNRGGFDSGRGFRGRGGFIDRGGMRGGFDGRGRGRGGNRGGGIMGLENGAARNGPDDNDSALEDFGAPGCVVSMENVPFRATIDEIMHFFSEFELTQDDIIRRFNERGQPTGDARVAFKTPFDAQRAVKTRHMDTIHDRRINLNIL